MCFGSCSKLKIPNFWAYAHMACTFFTSFLCNSCNFQYFILGWPTLVLGPSYILILVAECLRSGYYVWIDTLFRLGWPVLLTPSEAYSHRRLRPHPPAQASNCSGGIFSACYTCTCNLYKESRHATYINIHVSREGFRKHVCYHLPSCERPS